MLRITTHNDLSSVRLVVEGRLAAAGVNVLERSWLEAKQITGVSSIHVEFNDITFVHEEAKKLLKRMAVEGVHLSAKNIHMKAILKTIQGNNEEEL